MTVSDLRLAHAAVAELLKGDMSAADWNTLMVFERFLAGHLARLTQKDAA